MKKIICALLAAGVLGVSAAAAPSSFSDVHRGDWHYDYVKLMANYGIVSGYEDGTFLPSRTLTQGEFLTLLARTFYSGRLYGAESGAHWASEAYNATRSVKLLPEDDFLEIDEDSLDAPIDRKTVSVLFDRIMQRMHSDEALQTDALQGSIADFSVIDPQYADSILRCYARGILSGYTDGTFGPDRTLTRAEASVMLVRAAGFEVTEYWKYWYMLGDNYEKRFRIFGTEETDRYENEAAAKANIVRVTVPVWRLNRNTGLKTASTQSFQINKALADDLVKIFTEIFNDPSQFPIYEIGGYSWRGGNTSEHNSGLAVDINANENYQVYPDGRIGAGSYWKPYEDPFSIPEDGIVVQTFAKYGFSWGGNAWSSNNDYMHFSYLGR